MRRRPYSVVLLDEIEKAHPDVFNILLQVLDEGRLTDNKGRTADFRNTIIIMTSNMGSQIISEHMSKLTDENHEQVLEQTRVEVMELLRRSIRPEFLNRIDELIMFKPLTRAEIMEIVELQLRNLAQMLSRNEIILEYTEAAIDEIARLGFDPQYGARPVKRVLQREVLNELSKKILADEINKEVPIVLDAQNNELVFRN